MGFKVFAKWDRNEYMKRMAKNRLRIDRTFWKLEKDQCKVFDDETKLEHGSEESYESPDENNGVVTVVPTHLNPKKRRSRAQKKR